MGSLLSETFLQFFFGLTFKFDCLGNFGSNLLFGISNCCYVVSISVSNDFCGVGLGFLDNLSFDKLGLSSDRVVLQVSLGVDLLNLGGGLGLPLLFNLVSVSLDLFDLLLLSNLFELGLLLNILSLLFFDLFLFNFFFLIVLNSLLVSESLPFKGVLELIDSSLLHGGGDFLTQDDIGNNDSLDVNTLVTESVI